MLRPSHDAHEAERVMGALAVIQEGGVVHGALADYAVRFICHQKNQVTIAL